MVRSTSLCWSEECCTTICDYKSFLIWCNKLCTITVVQKLEDWMFGVLSTHEYITHLANWFSSPSESKALCCIFPLACSLPLGFLTTRIFTTLVFHWFAHAVANRCCICLAGPPCAHSGQFVSWSNFFRSTIIQSNWVAEQFVKRCWEMVCMPVMVPGGSNAIHISSSFMRASWSFCSGRMEASCNRCL